MLGCNIYNNFKIVITVLTIDQDRIRWEENLNYFIKSIDGEFGYNYDFTIYCNSKRFCVTVCPGLLRND